MRPSESHYCLRLATFIELYMKCIDQPQRHKQENGQTDGRYNRVEQRRA